MARTENHNDVRRAIWALSSLAVAILLAAPAGAQSLAEVAKKEKERREKLEASEGETRTITDVELRRAGSSQTLPTSRPTTAGSEDEGADSAAESEEDAEETVDPQETEAYWRGRLQTIDDRIQQLETRLQSPQYTMNPTGAMDRQRLERQLAEARSERQALLDEARRAGVPPGWLR